MGKPYNDAELLDYIRKVFEDEAKLEQHYQKQGWSRESAQAAAFLKLRKFLKETKLIRIEP